MLAAVPTPPASDHDVLLADGSTARIRPIGPDDAAAVRALHERASPESVVLRYFGPHRLSDAEVDALTHPDGIDRVVLVAERAGVLVGLTEYDRTSGESEAEVAFLVDDTFQGQGVGTIMLEHLAAEARRHGIRRFAADTLAQNHRMLGVLRGAGFARQYRRSSEVMRVVLDITPSPEAVAAADERDRQAVVRSMASLLEPRAVAVLGASRTPGTVGHELLRHLVAGGFQGPVYPVNPSASHVAALPCWPSLDAVPGPVDLAVVAVPAAEVADAVDACGRKQVRGLVVVSAGFAETGPAGAAAQRAVTRRAHQLGMRLVGPNCFGVLNTDPAVSLNATFSSVVPDRGQIGFAAQSGGLGGAILAEARQRRLGISSFVSLGNKADVSGNDAITWWEHDPATRVVLLYLESFGNPRKFSRLARRITRTTPVVAVKSGRTGAGRRAATAGASQGDAVVDALFRQTGVLRAATIEELFDVGEVLASQPVPRGRRVAVLSNAAGPGVQAADACVGAGLEVPELAPATQGALRSVSAPAARVFNPVDLATGASADTYGRAVQLLLADDEVDAVIVLFTPPLVTRADDVADAVAAAVVGARKPVVASFVDTDAARARLKAAGRAVPCFTYPETAARALARAADYGDWLRRPPGSFRPLDGLDVNEARRRAVAAVPAGGGLIEGDEALAVLAAAGVPAGQGGEDGLSAVAGFAQDPVFGPVVTFAVADGGEPLGAAATGLAPLTDVDAAELVGEAPGVARLEAAAGPDGLAALAEVLERLGRLAEDLPQVAEAECRPLRVAAGTVSVGGARLRLSAAPPAWADLRRLNR